MLSLHHLVYFILHFFGLFDRVISAPAFPNGFKKITKIRNTVKRPYPNVNTIHRSKQFLKRNILQKLQEGIVLSSGTPSTDTGTHKNTGYIQDSWCTQELNLGNERIKFDLNAAQRTLSVKILQGESNSLGQLFICPPRSHTNPTR